jgi:serine/threonine protein kinase/Flp pilus assembly protein TadD
MACKSCGRSTPEGVELCESCAARERGEETGVSTLGVQRVFDEIWGDRFRIEAQVGRGAMGAVFRARDTMLDRVVAIKLIRREFISSPEDLSVVKARFEAEIRAAGRLLHPNIVTLYDASESRGSFYIVMEFIDGKTVKEILRRHRRLPPERALYIARGICKGLDYAHSQGIIHRDIKPANIMVSVEDEVKIADFGIAKLTSEGGGTLTAPGQVVGTPHYLAPERLRSEDYDGRADLFAVGCILYEMLTGHRAFAGDRLPSIVFKILHEEPAPPSTLRTRIPPAWDEVVLRAMAKRPEDRYQTGEDLIAALEQAAMEHPAGDTQTGSITARRYTGGSSFSGSAPTFARGLTSSRTAPTIFSFSLNWTMAATKTIGRKLSGVIPALVLLVAVVVLGLGVATRIPEQSVWAPLRPQELAPALFAFRQPEDPIGAEDLRELRRLYESGDLRRALERIESLHARGAAPLSARLIEALILEELGDPAASRTIRELAAEEPGEPAVAALMADRAIRAGRWEEAEKALAALEAPVRDQPEFLYRRAVVEYNLGRPDRARELFQRYLEAHPDSASAYNNLGVAYYRRGEAPQALEALVRGSWFKDPPLQVLRNLALLRRMQGQRNLELEALQRWRERGGEDPELLSRLEELERS